MGQEQFQKLREDYQKFIYESYSLQPIDGGIACRFSYCLQGQSRLVSFTHEVRFQGRFDRSLTHPVLQQAVFLLGLAETINYWKLACPALLEVVPGNLTSSDVLFWQKLFTRGLGEFYWLNGLYETVSKNAPLTIVSVSQGPAFVAESYPTQGCLVPIGGGKDSVVSLELLKKLPQTADVFPIDAYLLSAREASYTTAAIGGFTDDTRLEAFRVFDPQLFRMNAEGFLNGHVPYSAILGFSSVVAALLHGKKYIVLSNEGSANEPTVPGTWVNHQYSKSLEFERDFSDYVRERITPDIFYFSLLRPWSEARIALDFAALTDYHKDFRSCNKGSKENRWCCQCSKCLFVFILLAAHLPVEQVAEIFGENLLDNASLIPVLDELTGLASSKPFECVGTVAETRWSMERIQQRHFSVCGTPSFALLDHFASVTLPDAPTFHMLEPELADNIPLPFLPLVLEVAERLKTFLEPHNIGILGFGLEGASTLRFLYMLLPQKTIHIGDKDVATASRVQAVAQESSVAPEQFAFYGGENYAQHLQACSLVFKAPGIPLKSIDAFFREEQLTSQTDLFLSALGHRTIGITGTKGKSTTSMLVFTGLNALGISVKMVGNMGLPAFDALMQDTPETVYVYELSSHMLETAHHSPRVAVFLNLYEEHLDHYRSFDDYAAAKANIFLYQEVGDRTIIGEQVPAAFLDKFPVKNAVSQHLSPEKAFGIGSVGALHFAPEDCFTVRNLPERASHLAPEAWLATRKLSEGTPHFAPEEWFAARKLPGRHNLYNMQMALLAIHEMSGMDSVQQLRTVVDAMNDFSGLKHRLEAIGTFDGIHFVNDSISTIPQTCIAAIETVENVGSLIFGGMDRGIDYGSLLDYLAEGKVKVLIGLPDTGYTLLKSLLQRPLEPKLTCVFAANMNEAVAAAYEKTPAGKTCLLSPAAASYGTYKNFEERGDHFIRAVKEGAVLRHGSDNHR